MKKFGKQAHYTDELAEDSSSKSQIKRELLAIKELGKQLLTLPLKDIDKLNLSERLHEQLVKAQGMSKGALKRQIATIGNIMVEEDHASIKQSIEKIRQTHNGNTKLFQQLETWRDGLIAGDKDLMTILHNQFVNLDLQHIRQLVRNANKETSQGKPPKSARLLFKYLQQCQAELECVP